MGGEGVPRGGFALAEGVGRDPFGDAILLGSPLDGFLHSVLMEEVEAATLSLLPGRRETR